MVKKSPKRVQAILKEVRKEFQTIYQDCIKEIILFGSYVSRGDFIDDSDIDIILLLEESKDITVELEKYLPVTGRLSLIHDRAIFVVLFEYRVFFGKIIPLI